MVSHPSRPARRRRRLTALCATSLALASVVGTQLPAAAAGITYKYPAPRMYGEITVWFKSKSAFVAKGFVKDRCPADGAGVYTDMWVRFKNGELGGFGSIGDDDNGCGNGRVRVGNPYGYTLGKRRVDNVYVQVCRDDRNDAKDAFCLTKVWDNPRVAG